MFKKEFIVGIVTTVGICGLIIGYYYLENINLWAENTTYYAVYSNASELKKGNFSLILNLIIFTMEFLARFKRTAATFLMMVFAVILYGCGGSVENTLPKNAEGHSLEDFAPLGSNFVLTYSTMDSVQKQNLDVILEKLSPEITILIWSLGVNNNLYK